MRYIVFVGLAVAVAAALPGQSSEFWKDLSGERAPSVTAKRWLNAGAVTPGRVTLRGKVWLLQFFERTDKAAKDKAKELSELHNKYFAKGFRVVAISDSSSKRLKKFVDEHGAKYWIGSDPRWKTAREYRSSGVWSSSVSTKYYLVDGRGRVVGDTIPSAKTIEKLLKQIVLVELGKKKLHPKLKAAQTAYECSAFGAAWKSAKRHIKAKEPKLADDAAFLQQRVEQLASFRKVLLEADMQDAEADECYGEALIFRYEFDGLRSVSQWIKAVLKKQADRSMVKKDIENWKRFEKMLRDELRGHASSFKRKKVKEAYKMLVKDNPRQVYGKIAKLRMARMQL